LIETASCLAVTVLGIDHSNSHAATKLWSVSASLKLLDNYLGLLNQNGQSPSVHNESQVLPEADKSEKLQ